MTTITHYRQVWTHKSSEGREYIYEFLMSDGSVDCDHTLPRDLGAAVELPSANRGPAGTWVVTPIADMVPVTLEAATASFCDMLVSRNARHAMAGE